MNQFELEKKYNVEIFHGCTGWKALNRKGAMIAVGTSLEQLSVHLESAAEFAGLFLLAQLANQGA